MSPSTGTSYFLDDNIAGDMEYTKELLQAIAPYRKWWTSQASIHAGCDDEFPALAARRMQAVIPGPGSANSPKHRACSAAIAPAAWRPRCISNGNCQCHTAALTDAD